MKSINEICEEYGIYNYTINEDGSIDVNWNVNLSGNGLTELPLTFNRVNGVFLCDKNELTTLKGSPKYVKSSFDCSENKLTSLEYSPEYVGNHFDCNTNLLTSLEYCPKKVGGNLFSMSNNIKNLYGISGDISGELVFFISPISSIFNRVDMDFVRAFNAYRVIKDDKVVLKRLKYVMETFDMKYNLEKIKEHYEII